MRTIAGAVALLFGLLAAGCNGEVVGGGHRPAAVLVVSGDLQTGTVGQELPQPLVVKVVDDAGRPVRDQLVNFRVTHGGGSVFAGSAITNREGIAQERWTLGTVAGDTQQVEARAVDPETGAAQVFATFRAIGQSAGGAVIEAIAPASGTGTAGQVLADSIRVRVHDQYGNLAVGVTVTWAATTGGGSVASATTTTDAQGIARNAWTLGTAAGPQVAQASIPGQPAVSFSVQAVAGAATAVQITPSPLSFTSLGEQIPLTITGTDPFGNPVAGAAVTVVSLNSTVVSLTAPATAVAQANGSTRIIATLQASGAADTVDAVVQQQVTSIVVTPSPLFLNPGTTGTLTAVGQDARGNPVAGTAVTWTTSAPGVATVAPNGTVTAHALGTATVTATSGTVSMQVQVSVNPPVSPGRSTMDVGAYHTCALTTAGEAYCWGRNEGRQLGLGVNHTRYLTTPQKVVGGHTFVAIAAKEWSTCALTAGGAVYCWGTLTGSGTPLLVSGGRSYKEIDGECGITTGGEWHCFRADGTYEHRAAGQSFAALDRCAISTAAQLYCGAGPLSEDPPFTPVSGVPPFAEVANGILHTCALTFSGQPYCNRFRTPGWAAMPSPVALTEIAIGAPNGREFPDLPDNQVCGISAQGHTYCGPSANGGMARFTVADPYTFVHIDGDGYQINSGSPSDQHYCALTDAGQIYCWGTNQYGELGGGSGLPGAPLLVAGGHTWATPSNPPPGAAARRANR
jgi:hypothetical protein